MAASFDLLQAILHILFVLFINNFLKYIPTTYFVNEEISFLVHAQVFVEWFLKEKA
jgi:hypothetical protein